MGGLGSGGFGTIRRKWGIGWRKGAETGWHWVSGRSGRGEGEGVLGRGDGKGQGVESREVLWLPLEGLGRVGWVCMNDGKGQ